MSTYQPWVPHMGTCGQQKAELAAFAGCGILSSYLVLFIMFYLTTYKKPTTKEALRTASKVEVPSVEETTDKAADALKSAGNTLVESSEGLRRLSISS